MDILRSRDVNNLERKFLQCQSPSHQACILRETCSKELTTEEFYPFPSAPPKGKKAQKDSPAPSPQGAAETEVPAKRRAEKSKRQEAPRETFNRFAPLAMDAEDTISSIWGDSSTPSSPRASASPMECPPSPSKSRPPPPAEKPQGPPPSPSPPYLFTPEVHVTEGVKPTKKIKGLAGQPKGGLPSNK
ncbi:hypothetical protein PoB_004150500 [Plakobranchus ocellatus]|uniref:Uncharacterized protein n=1 Tax=Plakobranchus ocellatus TaxID=259542 RepID=A0AAV4B7D2_9GAST|nr:hypothetical protein PoB_004150500 [Plakobranchus ocellatus]